MSKELVKGKLYVSKYGRVWLVKRFIGWDKMAAEFQIIGEFPSEAEANEYRANPQKEPNNE